MKDGDVTAHPVLSFGIDRPVRVQRSGNSRVLPVPADIGHGAGVNIGDDFVLEVVGADLLYRRAVPDVQIQGHGDDRVGVLTEGHVFAAPQRTALAPLDWDF